MQNCCRFCILIGQSVSQGVAVQGSEDTKNYALQALTEALDRAEAMVSGGLVEAPVSSDHDVVVFNFWENRVFQKIGCRFANFTFRR